jgi:uncharacterized radical SAM superfamily protein
MAGINFTCPHCGKKSRIEIMEIERLRRRIVELEMRLQEKSDMDMLMGLMGMGGKK